jgi:radical S-adenosyl methionine domain-containing protein 2
MKLEKKIPINFYILKECNYSCKICFSQFDDKKRLNYKEHLKIIDKLVDKVDKITFVGGEPLLYPRLLDLIKYSKSKGFITSIVTNGSKLTETFLIESHGYLDWVALSIDSLDLDTNLAMGRGDINNQTNYYKVINLLKKYKYKFKINTVVSKNNWKESFNEFIEWSNPDRWKIFQVLILDKINNQNKIEIDDYKFNYFIKNNRIKGVDTIIENNEGMLCSYYMIDPYGRLFDNTDYRVSYTESLLEIDLEDALKKLNVSLDKIETREGFYYKEN